MIPMAVPVFGGMIFEVITMLIVPVLFSIREERHLKKIGISNIPQTIIIEDIEK